MDDHAPTPTVSFWPYSAASVALAALSFELGGLYSKLHWKVLFVGGRLRGCVDSPSLTAAVQVLDLARATTRPGMRSVTRLGAPAGA